MVCIHILSQIFCFLFKRFPWHRKLAVSWWVVSLHVKTLASAAGDASILTKMIRMTGTLLS
jgi:hypothetical protein